MHINTRLFRLNINPTPGPGLGVLIDLYIHPGILFPILFILAVASCYWIRFR